VFFALQFEYDSLLDRVRAKLPEKTSSGERFEIPVFESFTQGTKTVIKNFGDVCSKLRRKPDELVKYLFKELATPGVIQGGQLVLQAKVFPRLIQEKLVTYVETHVMCKECGKPDTHIDSINRNVSMLVCEACGARRPVRK